MMMNKTGASFHVEGGDYDVVFVVDDYENVRSGPSVTNDAEGVLAKLKSDGYLRGPMGPKRVFYLDTDGQIDEIVHDDGEFVNFLSGTKSPAMLGKIERLWGYRSSVFDDE